MRSSVFANSEIAIDNMATRPLYIDSNVFIYLFEGHKKYAPLVQKAMQKQIGKGGIFITSIVSISELIVGASGSAELLQEMPSTSIIDVGQAIAEQAGLLRRQHPALQLGDCIHLATAICEHAETFMTNDKQLATAAAKHLSVISL